MSSQKSTHAYDGSAEVIRAMLKHESDVINQRVLWMASFQGLLFAALGFTWDKRGSEPLVAVFCLLGIAVSVLTGIGLIGASIATRRLLIWWENNKPQDYKGPGVIGLGHNQSVVFALFPPWNLLPMCFLVAWISVMVVNHFKLR